MGFREYFWAKKGFIITKKERTVFKTLPNGRRVTKTEKYTCLVKVLPQAIVDRTITLPDVEHIDFAAFDLLKKDYFSRIVLPKTLESIDQKGHVYPFYYLPHGVRIDIAEGNVHFFKIGKHIFENQDSRVESDNKIERQIGILNPKQVELIVSETGQKIDVLPIGELAPGGQSIDHATSIRVNNGAFKHTRVQALTANLLPGQNLDINGARDEHLTTYNMPDTIIVNGKEINQSQFLTHHGRMLIEIANCGGTVMVKHIDSVDYVGRFMNNDDITESIETWLGKLEQERKSSAFFNRNNKR